jgi:ribosomal protein S2
MLSYLKLLKILVALNLPYSRVSKKSAGSFFGTQHSLGFKHNIHFSSLYLTVPNIYRALNILTTISKNKGTVLFVGSTKEVQKFFFFFKYSSRRTIFLTKWVSGLLTNWDQLISFINIFSFQQISLLKKSKKLRFLKFFVELRQKEKPALVIVFNYNTNISGITQECLFENTPVIVFGSFYTSFAEKIPYSIQLNTRTFFTDWFFFQLFFNQINAK